MALARRMILGILGVIAAAGLSLSQNPPAPKEPDTTADDQKTLKAVGIALDGPSLLDYFRKRTLPTADPKKIQALINQLADDDFTTREEAYAGLVSLGAAAAAELRQVEQKLAKGDGDAEQRKRVQELKQRIEAKAEPAIQSAAARLIGRTKPAGAADVLLAYLPFAVDSMVVNDIARALGSVAVVDGKVEPIVVKSLADSLAVKRGIAAEALIRADAKGELAAARGLLKDADPQVRLRVAMALVPRRDKEVLPVLIDLMGELSPDQLWPAEEVLVRLAGDKAPSISLGTTEATRKAAREAWSKWYTAAKDNIDLAKLEQPEPFQGFTAIVCQSINRVPGKFKPPTFEVMELKADKTVRWKFEINMQAVDVQVVGENKVLVAEYQRGFISERDFKGAVIWDKQVGGNPISVQRLPNGNNFVVKNNGMVEFDRNGNQVYAYTHPQFNVMRGKKLRNGEVVFIANNGAFGIFTRMDAKNKVLKTFNINPVNSIFGSMDILPNGGILVPDMNRQRVVEYDADGKEMKSFPINWPLGACRLPNGNTLITCQNPARVVELDLNGTEVWSHSVDGNVFNARKR